MTNIWNIVKDRILDYVFGNDYAKIYDLATNAVDDKIEFELRIANTIDQHCDVESWNVYDKYLEAYTDLRDDVIVTCANPSFNTYYKRYRLYKNGGVLQEKTLISRFNSSGDIDMTLVAKISREVNIPIAEAKSLIRNPSSFARTYRTCYNIVYDKLSKRASKYLSNWSVDKTIRLISTNENENKIVHTMITDISHPVTYDVLDIEFEYIGEHKELEQSLLALIEFVYMAKAKTCNYKDISFEYQIYNQLSGSKLNSFMIKPEIRYYPNVRRTYTVGTGAFKLLIYIEDNNYIVLGDEEIDLRNFDDFGIYDYSVMLVMENEDSTLTILDIYIYHKESVYGLVFSDRRSKLEEAASNSSLLHLPADEDEGEENGSTISFYDDYKLCTFHPSVFRLNLITKLNNDGASYCLYTQYNVILLSPLLACATGENGAIYIPKNRNEFETRIQNKEVFIDNECVCFECRGSNGAIDLIPVSLATSALDDLRTAEYTILEAYAREEMIDTQTEYKCDTLSLMFQYTVEGMYGLSFNNVLLYAPTGGLDFNALKAISNFISYNKFIIKGTANDIVSNLGQYYSTNYISPITKAKLVCNSNSKLYTLNEEQNLFQIASVFNNDIDLIITGFRVFNKLTDLISLFVVLNRNITRDAIVIFNYINDHVNIFKFLYDIDKEMGIDIIKRIEGGLNPSRIGGGNYLVDLNGVNDQKRFIENMKKRTTLTLFKSCQKLGNKNIEYVGESEGQYYYRLNDLQRLDKEHASLRNFVVSTLKSQEDKISEMNDLTLFVTRTIGAYFEFNSVVSYPINAPEIEKLIAFQTQMFEQFKAQTRYPYRDYVSCKLTF